MTRLDREHAEARALMMVVHLHERTYPCLKDFYHIDSGRSTKAQGGRKKAEGVRKGIPDYCLSEPLHGFHGLYLELKAPGKKPTREQKAFLERHRDKGYATAWYDDWRPAWDFLLDYIEGRL